LEVLSKSRREKYPSCNKKKIGYLIGRVLPRNCLLKHIIEGKIEERIEEAERREKRRKQLLAAFKETK
jgi:hypothetical protein